MTDRTFVSSSHPVGRTLGWEALPPLGASRADRARVRHRLLAALTGFVFAGLLIAAMVVAG